MSDVPVGWTRVGDWKVAFRARLEKHRLVAGEAASRIGRNRLP